jgi:hypothetical protein
MRAVSPTSNGYRYGLILCLSMLGACALFGGQRFPVLVANSEYSRVVAQQQWHLVMDEQSHRLQAMIETGEAQLTLVLLDTLGQRIATLKQDERGLDIERHISHPIDPLLPHVWQTLQFIYWPLADLQQHGAPQWTFTEAAGVRQVYFSGILAGQIHYQNYSPWQGTARYANNKNGFQWVIESSQLQAIKR